MTMCMYAHFGLQKRIYTNRPMTQAGKWQTVLSSDHTVYIGPWALCTYRPSCSSLCNHSVSKLGRIQFLQSYRLICVHNTESWLQRDLLIYIPLGPSFDLRWMYASSKWFIIPVFPGRSHEGWWFPPDRCRGTARICRCFRGLLSYPRRQGDPLCCRYPVSVPRLILVWC